MAKNQIDLSIVISNFNNKELLRQTLLSVYEHIGEISFEIIVVDDCSTDGSLEMLNSNFPAVKTIKNIKNLGYSKSYNMGTKASRGRYILHLNSDVVFKNSSLEDMVAFMDKNREIGIGGCKILKLEGGLDLPCRRSSPTLLNIFYQTIGLTKIFPKSKHFGNYYLTYLDENKTTEVDCLMGAFMMIRREVIKKIGLLDEMFFIYGEDIDFCFRAKKTGWKIVYYPKVVIKHHHGGTTGQFRWKNLWRFHLAMFQYYNKHFAKKKHFLVNIIVSLGIILRFFLYAALEFFNSLGKKFKNELF